MKCRTQKISEELLEKKILLLSFLAGVGFVVIELLYSIYSGSQSTLTDALYDAAELVFIVLLLFLTPLFHQPISEKHPYGFFQLESFFILIKSIMLLSVTVSVLTSVIERLFLPVNFRTHQPLYFVCYEIHESQNLLTYSKSRNTWMEVGCNL